MSVDRESGVGDPAPKSLDQIRSHLTNHRAELVAARASITRQIRGAENEIKSLQSQKWALDASIKRMNESLKAAETLSEFDAGEPKTETSTTPTCEPTVGHKRISDLTEDEWMTLERFRPVQPASELLRQMADLAEKGEHWAISYQLRAASVSFERFLDKLWSER